MNEKQKLAIMEALREQGFRITKQRKIVIDIILENNCSCCKEIYYQANKMDSKIGIATVYRMVKTLEDIGAIDKKNQYKVSVEGKLKDITKDTQKEEVYCACEKGCMVILKNHKKIRLNSAEFNQALKAGLDIIGFASEEEIDSIELK
ncbi:MAG: Fur family transcriptional regulator [Clostridiales bacterium]|nr:Fur family transcriptional regulator [Clostridiales bacterium]